MSKLIDQAMRKLPNLSEADQEEVAKIILAKTEEPVTLSAAEKAAIADGHADTSKGHYAPDDTIKKQLARLRSTVT